MAEESDADLSILPNEEAKSDISNEHDLDMDCESMIQALTFYNEIVEHSGSKDIKKKDKKALRINALAMVKIVASQNTYIAQLEGRIQQMEKQLSDETNTQHALISEAIAQEIKNILPAVKDSSKPTKAGMKSFAAVAAKGNIAKKDQQPTAKPKSPPKRQHLAVVKPLNAQSSSANTRNLVQKNIDVNRLKIGVKKVSPIKNGGILIETVEEADLATLVKELESNEYIAKDFTVAKP
ncbi:hypothetical protein CDAR_616941 [Caerostris darwini]|uniref:Uncharacterized protein n=1 Tax=Caerostris darwini TaxID=1538125 RepID=A0AAV4NTQ2_9ARAC|nr:hypothetical protein CDAR_616941 [Caerostris darwini]